MEWKRRRNLLALTPVLAGAAVLWGMRGTPETAAAPIVALPDSAAIADSIAAWELAERARLRACVARLAQELESGADADPATGEDPAFAQRMGWPVRMPEPRFGSILPCNRVVAYYGNPLSKRMGVLGEYPKDEMLRRFRRAVAEWEAADPAHPVVPALHLIVLVAQSDSGRNNEYNLWMPDTLVELVYGWAREAGAILFLDLQIGTSTVQEELPRLEKFLRRPDVHLALDPEFAMKHNRRPGEYIGTMDASEINWAARWLAALVNKHDLPPKLLVVHRFTDHMVTNSHRIELRPEVQVIIDMDGWGGPALKRNTYASYIVREPVQFAGFKIFYHNDVRVEGWRLMTPDDVLRLRPAPLYIQYQ